MTVRADLHIHSCLSPCGSLEMSPSRIVKEAIGKNLSFIAITDHNTCKNALTLQKLCNKHSLFCLYGMEITTSEEIHILAYFQKLETAMDFDTFIYNHLPDLKNRPELFGDQVVVDEEENIIEEVEKYLGNAIDLNLSQTISSIHAAGGFVIPAHISRPHFSLISQLGWIPAEPFDALELSTYYFKNQPKIELPNLTPLITGSDAHYPADIGRNYIMFDTNEKPLILPWTVPHEILSEGKTVTI